MPPFGFGPMSPFYDEDFESALDPLFLDEFIFYEEDGSYRGTCPNCGNRIKIRRDAEKVRCRNCDSKFRVNYRNNRLPDIDLGIWDGTM